MFFFGKTLTQVFFCVLQQNNRALVGQKDFLFQLCFAFFVTSEIKLLLVNTKLWQNRRAKAQLSFGRENKQASCIQSWYLQVAEKKTDTATYKNRYFDYWYLSVNTYTSLRILLTQVKYFFDTWYFFSILTHVCLYVYLF